MALTQRKRILGGRFFGTFASFMIVVAGLKYSQTICVPFLFAVFLTILTLPAVTWLIEKRVPKTIAVIGVALLVLGLFIGVGVFIGGSVNSFTNSVPIYSQKLNLVMQGFDQWLLTKKIGLSTSNIFNTFELGDALDLVGKTLKGSISAVSKFIIVLIITCFMLFEAADFRSKIKAAIGASFDLKQFEGMTVDVQRYLLIKTITSAITGVLVGLWVWAMGVDFPVLWALLAFLLNYIPFLGSNIAAVPAILLALVQHDFWWAIYLLCGYIVINFSVSNFLEPILMGRRLGLSVLVVFLSLVFWGWVWGPAGALMSVPLTMIVKILLEHIDDFNWIAILMSNRVPKPEQ